MEQPYATIDAMSRDPDWTLFHYMQFLKARNNKVAKYIYDKYLRGTVHQRRAKYIKHKYMLV